MSDLLYAVLVYGGFLVAFSCFVGANVCEVRIGMRLDGVSDVSVAALRSSSRRSLASARCRHEEIRVSRMRAFTRGSDIDPELRRLHVLARRLRRTAWLVGLAAVLTGWTVSGVFDAAPPATSEAASDAVRLQGD